MFITHILANARKRLVTIGEDEQLLQAAQRLTIPNCDMVVVCGSDSTLCGIVTKTDVVTRISQCDGHRCMSPVSAAMARDVVCCGTTDNLQQVWTTMKARMLKNMPVLDENRRPIGIVNVHDVLSALLAEVENEEALLRDYVMSVGYR